MLVLQGDPGIGKTALVDYAAARAGPMRILRATGIEAETELAFAGLHSLLHPVAGYLAALPERRATALQTALGLGTAGLLRTAGYLRHQAGASGSQAVAR